MKDYNINEMKNANVTLLKMMLEFGGGSMQPRKRRLSVWQITMSQIFVVSSGILIKPVWNVRECQGIFFGQCGGNPDVRSTFAFNHQALFRKPSVYK